MQGHNNVKVFVVMLEISTPQLVVTWHQNNNISKLLHTLITLDSLISNTVNMKIFTWLKESSVNLATFFNGMNQMISK